MKTRVVELHDGVFVPQVLKGWSWKGVDCRLSEPKFYSPAHEQRNKCGCHDRVEAENALKKLLTKLDDVKRLTAP